MNGNIFGRSLVIVPLYHLKTTLLSNDGTCTITLPSPHSGKRVSSSRDLCAHALKLRVSAGVLLSSLISLELQTTARRSPRKVV